MHELSIQYLIYNINLKGSSLLQAWANRNREFSCQKDLRKCSTMKSLYACILIIFLIYVNANEVITLHRRTNDEFINGILQSKGKSGKAKVFHSDEGDILIHDYQNAQVFRFLYLYGRTEFNLRSSMVKFILELPSKYFP